MQPISQIKNVLAQQREVTIPTSFNRHLGSALIDQLEAAAKIGGWWKDVLADPNLVVGLRGKYLNVYWRGQSLFYVEAGTTALKITTHAKFLIDPALNEQVSLTKRKFDVDRLSEPVFISEYTGPETLKKLKTSAGLYSGDEKTGCHEIAVNGRNGNILDVEITFPGKVSRGNGGGDKTGPRVDFASVERDGDHARLVFWEAKTYQNSELRANPPRKPSVLEQIDIYRKYLADHRDEVERSYTEMAKNLVAIKAMGWQRSLSPLIQEIAAGKRRLSLEAEPKIGLLIFGFDAAQRDSESWKNHLDRLREEIPDIRLNGDAKSIVLGE